MSPLVWLMGALRRAPAAIGLLARDGVADLWDAVWHLPVPVEGVPVMVSRPALRFLARRTRELHIWADDSGTFQMLSCSTRPPRKPQGPFAVGEVKVRRRVVRIRVEQSIVDVYPEGYSILVFLRWLPWRRPYVDNGRYAGAGRRTGFYGTNYEGGIFRRGGI